MDSQLDSHAVDDALILPRMRAGLIPASSREAKSYYSAEAVDLDLYDYVVLCMSAGKDSLACALHLRESGLDMRKLELWHHDVDGREGSRLMDWTFMADYNRKIAAALGVPLYFSWLEGGMEGEMLKENGYSRPHKVETPDGLVTLERDTVRAQPNTRLMFPQQAASLASRWCSSALKIDVGRRALNNQSRFDGKRVLFITGERRQESSNRAKYNQLERHACDRRDGRKARLVDAWRPVLEWDEAAVWDILRRNRVIAPVPYRLGWGRSSCLACVFNGPRIWATISKYFPDRAAPIAEYEDLFGKTISRQKINVITVAANSRPFEIDDLEALEQAVRYDYTLPVLLEEGQPWIMPAGAFGKDGCGSV